MMGKPCASLVVSMVMFLALHIVMEGLWLRKVKKRRKFGSCLIKDVRVIVVPGQIDHRVLSRTADIHIRLRGSFLLVDLKACFSVQPSIIFLSRRPPSISCVVQWMACHD